MERIDKILSKQTHYSRKEIKKLISLGKIYVNNEVVLRPENKYDENSIEIKIENEIVEVKKYIYLLLNKPMGYVSTTDTENEKSVLELVPKKYRNRNLFPAGRLDKDTTGLMLITDDGEFAHEILSPKKHVKKEYEVTLDIPLTEEMVSKFKEGIMLNDGECKSAQLVITGNNTGNVTLTEGRYHQIKRMFGCFGGKVIKLNRIGIGNLYLKDDLKIGGIKELTVEDLDVIRMNK